MDHITYVSMSQPIMMLLVVIIIDWNGTCIAHDIFFFNDHNQERMIECMCSCYTYNT